MDNVDKIKLKEAIKTLRKRYGKDAIGIIG